MFRAISEESVEEPDLERWRALQVWLEGSERRVSVPYARELAEKMGDVAVRLRWDFSVILSLIRSHALLHQATRDRDGEGRIVASIEDYARVRGLVADLVAEGVEATVPPIVRQTVKAVARLIRVGDEEHATNRAVAEVLKIDKAAASRRVKVAVDRGYLRNLEDRKGRPARLVVGESMPEDAEILPLPEDLEEVLSGCAVDRDFGGIQHPPPPSSANSSSRPGGREAYTSSQTGSTGQHPGEAPEERERFAL